MLIYLNIQTTGLEEEDKICSFGLIYEDNTESDSFYELVNEGKTISSYTSSINNITNEMLKDKPVLLQSDIYDFLVLNNNQETTIVGHDIIKSMKRLEEYGYVFKGSLIDTRRIAKHLFKESESYSLEFLRYDLKLYHHEKEEALSLELENTLCTTALYKSLLIKLLYKYLLSISSKDKMYELTFEKVLLEKFDFGKYKGFYIEEIIMNDKSYIGWILERMNDFDEDLIYTLEHYIEGY